MLRNGLECDTVEYHSLPIVHLQLVVRNAGSASDPEDRPGLAAFVGDMLKEGTRGHDSVQLAEAIEFLGASLDVHTSADATIIAASVLREHLETLLALLGELVVEPVFPAVEVDRLRRREMDRLTQSLEEPSWLSRRAFYARVYGHHPYSRVDTTVASLQRLTRGELQTYHRDRYRAGSMLLAVVGDVTAADVAVLADRTLGRIRHGRATAAAMPSLPRASVRTVIIVDRPDSAQSVLRIGNTAIRRSSDDYVPLTLANHVLGGDASSRLFLDLRERRSLTYGAYSHVATPLDVGTFQASGSVRTEVTGEALDAFMQHLARIVHEPASGDELAVARGFLVDSFPLAIETPGDLLAHLVELRLFGLPDAYWDGYRSRIEATDANAALQAARRSIRPDECTIVIVGRAEAFEQHARRYGPVRVVDREGRMLRQLPALTP